MSPPVATIPKPAMQVSNSPKKTKNVGELESEIDAEGKASPLYEFIYSTTSKTYGIASAYLPPAVIERVDHAVLAAKTNWEHPEQLEQALLEQYHVPAPIVNGSKQAIVTAFHVKQRAYEAASQTGAVVSHKVSESVEKAKNAYENTRKQVVDTAINVANSTIPVVERIYSEQAAPLIHRAYVIAEPYYEKARPYTEPYVEKAKPYVEPVVKQVKDAVDNVRRQRLASQQTLMTPKE